ncbi:bacteriocin [Lactococcus lactis]|nr:ComC/BlpC family leader-containing pheromone/bacteriocin [Lactococcus lactis]MCT3114444.1 bacteriocin [Lactococcus lactis]
MKKEYNKSAYKVNEKEFFKMKTQELNLKQFVMLSEKELQEISGGGG